MVYCCCVCLLCLFVVGCGGLLGVTGDYGGLLGFTGDYWGSFFNFSLTSPY